MGKTPADQALAFCFIPNIENNMIGRDGRQVYEGKAAKVLRESYVQGIFLPW